MKVLYIIKDPETDTLKRFIEIHSTKEEVKVLRIDNSTSSDALLDEIERADRIISW